jgi:hypothetical protein
MRFNALSLLFTISLIASASDALAGTRFMGRKDDVIKKMIINCPAQAIVGEPINCIADTEATLQPLVLSLT